MWTILLIELETEQLEWFFFTSLFPSSLFIACGTGRARVMRHVGRLLDMVGGGGAIIRERDLIET